MSKRKIIAILLIVGGFIVLGHQWLMKGVLIEPQDVDSHEFIAFVLVACGIGGFLFCKN